MRVIKNERIIPTDIDETLIMHDITNASNDALIVEIIDPYAPNTRIQMRVNEPMVKILKDEKVRGSYIIAWSKAGYQWAEAVIRALGLESFVDLIMTKPIAYMDDTPVEHWLKDRIYIKSDVIYKKS